MRWFQSRPAQFRPAPQAACERLGTLRQLGPGVRVAGKRGQQRNELIETRPGITVRADTRCRPAQRRRGPAPYWSRYEPQWLRDRVGELKRWPGGADRWCIFDNTAAGHAISNALELRELLQDG
jgi:uncharacterized protein YecE (DUF72 family)